MDGLDIVTELGTKATNTNLNAKANISDVFSKTQSNTLYQPRIDTFISPIKMFLI